MYGTSLLPRKVKSDVKDEPLKLEGKKLPFGYKRACLPVMTLPRKVVVPEPKYEIEAWPSP